MGKLINRIPDSRLFALRERMLNRLASLAMSTSVLKALPGKPDIKRHSPSILYISASLTMSTSVLKALPGKPDIKRHSPSILYISASLAMSTSVLKALPGKPDIKRHSPSILYLTSNCDLKSKGKQRTIVIFSMVLITRYNYSMSNLSK